jgi:hypothetical protein
MPSALFVIETRGRDGHWLACSTRASERAALDCAWALLSRAGGDVRVRLGARVVAEGHRYRSAT